MNWIYLVGDNHPSKIYCVNISWWYLALVANYFWVYRRLNNHPKVDFIINEINIRQSESESCLQVQNLVGYPALMALENPVVQTSLNQSNLGWTPNWTWGLVQENFLTLNWTWSSVLDGSGSNWSSELNFSTTTHTCHAVRWPSSAS